MANFIVPESSSYSDTMREIEPTDAVESSFINGYFLHFLKNDFALKKMITSVKDTVDKTTSHFRFNKLVQLNQADWKESNGVFYIEVPVVGLSSERDYEMKMCLVGGESSYEVSSYTKAYSLIYAGDVQNGKVKFFAKKRPSRTISIYLKGVA